MSQAGPHGKARGRKILAAEPKSWQSVLTMTRRSDSEEREDSSVVALYMKHSMNVLLTSSTKRCSIPNAHPVDPPLTALTKVMGV